MPKRYTTYLVYAVLMVLLYMPIFGHLTTLPIRLWDESRLAMNAYEMLHNGNLLVTHFAGEPDMWNTKPPLLIWLQAGLMKLIGVNELAVRLPSAVAAFLTSVLLLVFGHRYLRSLWLGVIAALVLVTSAGYISVHASRTGDYDALLTLFSTLASLCLFVYTERKQPRYLYGFFVATALAVLTKGIAGLLFAPAWALYCLVRGQVVPLLRNRHFYLGALTLVVLVGGYYLLREANNAGYLAAVAANELGGRYLEVNEEHQQGFWYYYANMIKLRFVPWYLLFPPAVAVGLAIREQRIRRLTIFCVLLILSYFLLISAGQTKLEWYDVPLYPLLALVIGSLLYYGFQLLRDSPWLQQRLSPNVLPFVFLFLIMVKPYQAIVGTTYKPQETAWDQGFFDIGYYLQSAVRGEHDLSGHYLLIDGYQPQTIFYLQALIERGVAIERRHWTALQPHDMAIAYQENVKAYVVANYEHTVVQTHGTAVTYKIHGKKHVE